VWKRDRGEGRHGNGHRLRRSPGSGAADESSTDS
jgi:hypothetical protein